MDTTSITGRLEREWDLEEGFLGRLRHGMFDPEGLERLVAILQLVQIEETATVLDRRLVELTWWIPRFMDWQVERVQEQGGDIQALEHARGRIAGLLEHILGVP